MDLSVDNQPLLPSPKVKFLLNTFKKKRLSNLKNFSFRVKFISLAFLTVILVFTGLCFQRRASHPSAPYVPPETLDTSDWTKLMIPNRQPPVFNLQPTTKSAYGILPQETLQLTSQVATNLETINSLLQSSTKINVKQISSTQYSISPSTVLPRDYTWTLALNSKDKQLGDSNIDRDYSWAFQSQPKFSLTGTLPANSATGVPVTTGIEFIFNLDDYDDPGAYISTSPAFSYRLERHETTLVVVPLNRLAYDSDYQVTLKKGLSPVSHFDPLTTDVSLRFHTASEPQPQVYLNMSRSLLQFNPDEQPIFKVYAYGQSVPTDVQLRLYKLPSSSAFVTASAFSDRYGEPNKTPDVSSFTLLNTTPVQIESHDTANYYDPLRTVTFPDQLPEGFYLVQLWYQNNTRYTQALVQSTSLSGVVSISRNQVLVWANDNATETPLSGAKVNLFGSTQSAYTSDGVAVFPTSQSLFKSSSKPTFLEISQDQRQLLLPVNNLSGRDSPSQLTARDFWSYFYQDRQRYLPTDTINFWGIIRNRDTNTSPGNLTVKLIDPHDYYDGDQDTIIQSQSVSTDSSGVFTSSIDYTDIAPGWYHLSVYNGDLLIDSTYITIDNFTKPEMEFSLTQDKQAIFANDSVNFTARANFYDTTPVKDVPIQIYSNFSGQLATLNTKNQGLINYQYSSPPRDPSYEYQSHTITFTPKLSQEELSQAQSSVDVFNSHLAIRAQADKQDSQVQITGTLYNIDLTGRNNGTTTNYLGAPAANRTITISTTETWYEKNQAGTRYDYVEKVTYPYYTYTSQSKDLTDITVQTDQSGQFTIKFPSDVTHSYRSLITAIDDSKLAAQDTVYAYSFRDTGSSLDTVSAPVLTLTRDNNLYSLGETVEARIEQPSAKAHKYLFIRTTRGHQDFFVTGEPKLNFTFTSDMVPNTYVSAISYDGKSYSPIREDCRSDWYCNYYDYYDYEVYLPTIRASYKSSDAQLQVAVTMDKSKYAPGENAQVSVQVTKDTNPVPNASVNLLLVDKALRAIDGINEPSPLSSLYSITSSDLYYFYYSHRPITQINAAEKGGGGEGDYEYRQDFKNTAHFQTLTTDSQGIATFTTKLPDNITTWLVFAQAVNQDLQTGFTESSLITTKDFFITLNTPSSILTSDQAYFALNSFGTNVNPNQPIQYDAKIIDQAQSLAEFKVSGTTSSDAYGALPKLTPGQYQLAAGVKFANVQDGLIRDFQVRDSWFQLTDSQDLDLNSTNININGIIPNTNSQLVLTDQGRAIYYWPVTSLCYTNSNRIEKQLTSVKAFQVINKYFDKDSQWCPQPKLDLNQNQDGGLSQVKWGTSDLDTTVWAIYADPKLFDKPALIKYLDSFTNKEPKQKIISLFGLTLLGESRLNQIKTILSQDNSYQVQVIGALALAHTADTESARDLYLDLLARYAYQNNQSIRIQQSQTITAADLDKLSINTAHALQLGHLVDQTYNQQLFNYIKTADNYDATPITDNARLVYYQEQLDSLPIEDTVFHIQTNSRSTDIHFSNCSNCIRLTIPYSELSSLKVSLTKGSGIARLFSTINAQEALHRQPKATGMTISRTLTPVNSNKTLQVSDFVIINIHISYASAGPGIYQVTDILPSGLAYIDSPSKFNLQTQNGYLYEQSGQVNKFLVYNSIYGGDLIYYARVIAPGSYQVEPTLIQSTQDPQIFAVSPKTDNLNISQ